MRSILFLLIIFLAGAVIAPVAAADVYDPAAMLKKAQQINTTVPDKGTAVLGSKESMTEMTGWLNDLTASLNSLINSVFGIFGMNDSGPAANLTRALGGIQQQPGSAGTK
jgi:hypothetical protein